MTQVQAAGPHGLADAGLDEIRVGHLGVRLAESAAELDASQALRWQVFYEEMGAVPDAATAARRRDADAYDPVADHLLVLDHDRGEGASAVVGTYRLIRRPAAEKVGAFYSASEYDLSPIVANGGALLELGRSCVHAAYRSRGTLQLLWQGIAAYVFRHRIELMFGCASLHGTDPDSLAVPLSYLRAHHLAPEALRARALPHLYVDMDRLPAGAYDPKRALAGLPPLVKGYLRLGGFVGDGAVVDRQFNTTDVCIVVKTDLVTRKYLKHYERKISGAGEE